MDIPKQRNKHVSKVCFESSESSCSEDGDSVFNKYSCTPPSRQNLKGMQKRRELRMMNSPKSCRSRTPDLDKTEKEKNKDKSSPTHRWQQRETSKQRESERMMKWITSSNMGNSASRDSAPSAVDVYPSDDEVKSEVNTPNQQGLKVSCNCVFIPLANLPVSLKFSCT